MGGKKRIKDDIDFYKKLGDKIRNIRLKENLTQKELGDYLRVSNQIIAGYEKGNINIPFYSIVKLSKIFGVSIDYLLAKPGSIEESSAKCKIDLEGVSLAFKHKNGFNDDPYEITELLKNIFFGEPHNLEHDALELTLVKDIFMILSVNLKMEIPFNSLLDRDYRNNFILRQIPHIYSSKNENAIKRLNWDVNLILFIFGYIDIAENIETHKEQEEKYLEDLESEFEEEKAQEQPIRKKADKDLSQKITQKVKSIMNGKEADNAIENWELENYKLEEEQKKALKELLTNKEGFTIITGEQGKGKQAILKAELDLMSNYSLDNSDKVIVLSALYEIIRIKKSKSGNK